MLLCETRLVEILKKSGVVKYGNFKLRGKESNYYIDIKKAATNPKILRLISNQITRIMLVEKISADYIACLEMGSIPIGTIVSVDTGLPLLIVRKLEKEHGLEGRIVGDFEKGGTALLVEDVTTLGGNVGDGVRVLRDNGLIVENVMTVVDREEGAIEALKRNGINLIPLMTTKELKD